eukprot:TRINITY_DN3759_c0_g1_i18.p1 TRINITY_DN3759_c0_g1~~TRINITY_DN3759_c0_g1_i18.p1  ORF type:complete len:391 (+),score=71.93 TRINITY_DN3759_c0_g1_i18:115-1287(+)
MLRSLVGSEMCIRDSTNVGITDVAHVWTMWPLAFMLVFRVSQAYARFWEGKGHFVNFYFAIRTLARRTFTYIKDTDEGPVDQDSQAMRQNMMRLLLVMAIAVRSNLRKRTLGQLAHDMNMEEVKPYLTAEEHREYSNVVKNRPLLVMAWIGKVINQAHVANKLEGGIILMGFDTDISHMLTGWMGMNKVCYQPMPFMHIHMLHVLLLGWCCSYPFTLVDAYGWWTIPCASGICCILFSLEEVAEEIEDPFGDDLNDLPLEEFELGLKRDTFLCMSGPGPGQRGQDFEPKEGDGDTDQIWNGVDFSVPTHTTTRDQVQQPVYHLFNAEEGECLCKSCARVPTGSRSPPKSPPMSPLSPGRASPPLSPLSPVAHLGPSTTRGTSRVPMVRRT